MNTRLRRNQLLGIGISGILLVSLAACSNDEPTGFITPSPSPQGTSTGEGNRTDTPTEEPTDPSVMPEDFDTTAPFGISGLDAVEVDEEVRTTFPEADVDAAAFQAMDTLQFALSLEPAWENRERTVEDYLPLQERLTPLLWERLVQSVAEGAPDGSVAQVVAPGWQAIATGLTTADGTPFVPNAEVPVVAAVAPTIHVAQDQAWFADETPRLEARTSYWLTFQGTANGEPAQTTYRLDARLYFEYNGETGKWLLDGKNAKPILETVP